MLISSFNVTVHFLSGPHPCQVVNPDELSNDEDYEEILEDMREECAKYGSLTNVVIPRPPAPGATAPGVGKVSLFASSFFAMCQSLEFLCFVYCASIMEKVRPWCTISLLSVKDFTSSLSIFVILKTCVGLLGVC